MLVLISVNVLSMLGLDVEPVGSRDVFQYFQLILEDNKYFKQIFQSKNSVEVLLLHQRFQD
jgi:hypothetical protein